MSATKDRAIRNIRRFAAQFEGRRDIQRAVLGHPDGSTVRVAGRPDLVYVRLKAQGSGLWKVFNDKVPDDWGLPVLIEKRPVGSMWEIIDVDKETISVTHPGGWGGDGLVPTHAPRHEWPDQVPGQDPVNIYPRAMVPLRSYARTYASLSVQMAPYRYTYDGVFKNFWGGAISLATYQPAAGYSRYVLTYLDPRTNTPHATPGGITTYSATILPPFPDMPEYAIPSALVRVWGNQSYVVENDIIDYRIIFGMNVPDQAGGVKTPSYVVMTYTPELQNERKLTVGDGLLLTDGGAGGAAHIRFATTYAPQSPAYVTLTYHDNLPNERKLIAGSNITITDQGPDQGVEIASTGGGGGAPTDAQYVVLTYDGDLSDERVLLAGSNITITDQGANAGVVIASTATGDDFFWWGW